MLKTLEYDLSSTFTKRIVEAPAGFLVMEYTGQPDTVYVKVGSQGDPVYLALGQVVIHPANDKSFYIVNTQAQSGTLKLLLASSDALGSLVRPILSAPNPNGVAAGSIDVGTSPTQLPDQPVPGGRAVVVTADPDNTDKIYIGGSTVTTSTGHELSAGSSVHLYVSNVNAIYAVAGVTGQKVRYLVEVIV